jgi:hypothetical protein
MGAPAVRLPPPMKTRTLLLLSVACGLAIMLAGAALLLQLASQDDTEQPLAIGDAAEVGDMTVTVLDTLAGPDGELSVSIRIGGADDPTPETDFRLIAAGRPLQVADTTCPPIGSDAVECDLVFDVSAVDGTSRVLFYDRGDEQARWQLV